MKAANQVLVALAVTLSSLTVLAAASNTIPLVGENLYPEGIAYRASTKTFYVGSAGNGSLQTVTEEGDAKILQPGGTDGRVKALGVHVDERHNHLWLVDGKAIYVYTLDTNQLLKKIDLADLTPVKESALNDIAVDKNGSAFVTDSFNAHIIRVDGESLRGEVWAKLSNIPFGKQNDFAYNLNGIVITPDQSALIAVKTNDGTLWKINIKNKKATEIKLTEAVTKGDGLAWGAPGQLYVIRNFENKISVVDVLAKTDVKSVRTISPENVTIPTTGVYLPGPQPKLVVVNSQFEVKKLAPFTLAVVPAP